MRPESARLTFRDMTPDDLDDLALLLGDPEVMTYYPRPKTRAEAAQWIEWNLGLYRTHGYGLWLLTTADEGFVGDCGLTPQVVDGVTELEVGYHVRPALQGRGYATEAAAATPSSTRRPSTSIRYWCSCVRTRRWTGSGWPTSGAGRDLGRQPCYCCTAGPGTGPTTARWSR